MDNEIVISKWYFTKEAFRPRFTDIPELQQGYQRFSVNLGLWHYWRILGDCRTRDEYKEIDSHAGGLQHPRDFIHNLTDSRNSFELDDIAMDKIQESMRQLLISGRAISTLEEKPMRAEHLSPCFRQSTARPEVANPYISCFRYGNAVVHIQIFPMVKCTHQPSTVSLCIS